jgi:hypothetical protein
MRGAIPPLSPYVFMTWCSVKAQGQLYLYLFILLSQVSEMDVTGICKITVRQCFTTARLLSARTMLYLFHITTAVQQLRVC